LNKRRSGKAVLKGGGFMDVEAEARATNAEPWESPYEESCRHALFLRLLSQDSAKIKIRTRRDIKNPNFPLDEG
jgi:hypothetical protein